jgi:hypothetical protein
MNASSKKEEEHFKENSLASQRIWPGEMKCKSPDEKKTNRLVARRVMK